jgi:molybdenum cofactor biosynthesis enzyme MoaA
MTRTMSGVLDSRSRPLRDLRVSVTRPLQLPLHLDAGLRLVTVSLDALDGHTF